jgi:hypothetical protein
MTTMFAVKSRSSCSWISFTFEPSISAKTRMPPRPCIRMFQGTDSAAVALSRTILP